MQFSLASLIFLAVLALPGRNGTLRESPPSSAPRPSARVAALLKELKADMVVIPSGTFQMGSDSGQGEDEQPVHAVSVPSFLLSRYEVTAAQFAIFEQETGRTPVGGGYAGPDHPAANISWDDAVAFTAWLNRLGDVAYRLPSEAEWEFAARGGSSGRYWWGDSYQPGNVNGSGLGAADVWAETAPVHSLPANPFGLFNVLGNVWEWTADCYFPDYTGAAADGSARTGDEACGRVLRGGSWSDTPAWLRTSTRNWFDRAERFDYVGFRLAADLKQETRGER